MWIMWFVACSFILIVVAFKIVVSLFKFAFWVREDIKLAKKDHYEKHPEDKEFRDMLYKDFLFQLFYVFGALFILVFLCAFVKGYNLWFFGAIDLAFWMGCLVRIWKINSKHALILKKRNEKKDILKLLPKEQQIMV
ncbi:hypothetical protein BKH43_04605 [Helicobacter sp. 13S00401-1]|uniref:hypothetical protein n=1 Tax=Helicobacter sp. 13S00401-1 TaxID=1905758 RepID=UPI000BA69F22|nr:hypothetical protein [Helicobacter sp. 13S00401-1]PAF50376.1 hypothetical protein BKH43_04605 [Helicobacter sp. 13S00401-1]